MALIITIKFAGPDNRDRFKCLSVKGRLVVDPGKIYARRTITVLNRVVNNPKYDVITIEPRFDSDEKRFREFKGPRGDDLS